MRIITTEQGGTLMKILSTEKIENVLKKSTSPKKTNKQTEVKTKLEDEIIVMNLRKIEIKNKKLSIPKNIAEKYNEIKFDEPSLLPNLYANIKKSPSKNDNSNFQQISEDFITKSTREDTQINTNENDDGLNQKKLSNQNRMGYSIDQNFIETSYKMKDIISDDCLNNMRKNITSEVKLKNRLASVISIDFRLPFLTPIKRINEMNNALASNIKSDNSNILNYLSSNDTLSPKFIKSISKYDEDKFVRLNKVCQRVLNNKGEENDLKNRINMIIESNHEYEKADYKKKMNKMEIEVNSIKSIFDRYPQRDEKDKYENLLHDMKKNHWNKYNFERLMKRSQRNLKTDN
jgi:hypothetical protein